MIVVSGWRRRRFDLRQLPVGGQCGRISLSVIFVLVAVTMVGAYSGRQTFQSAAVEAAAVLGDTADVFDATAEALAALEDSMETYSTYSFAYDDYYDDAALGCGDDDDEDDASDVDDGGGGGSAAPTASPHRPLSAPASALFGGLTTVAMANATGTVAGALDAAVDAARVPLQDALALVDGLGPQLRDIADALSDDFPLYIDIGIGGLVAGASAWRQHISFRVSVHSVASKLSRVDGWRILRRARFVRVDGRRECCGRGGALNTVMRGTGVWLIVLIGAFAARTECRADDLIMQCLSFALLVVVVLFVACSATLALTAADFCHGGPDAKVRRARRRARASRHREVQLPLYRSRRAGP